MATKTVAEIIVDTIQAAGIQRVYGVVGEGLAGLLEAIRTREGMALVEVRNEEAAAFAAGGEANVTHSLAVCVGSCGPGDVQLLNGLYDCHRSHLPVLAIMAQVPSDEIGSSYFQETRPELLFRECSHYCESISVPEQAVRVAEAAVQAAISLGGVGIIVLPSDVALLEAEAPAPLIAALGHHSAIVPASPKIAQAAQLLNSCKNITILAGSGIAGAHRELLQVAQTLQAPVVYSLHGKECAQPHNPFGVGLTGPQGMPAGYHALLEADGVLMLGTDFPHRQYFPANARVVQVDMRPEHLGRRTRVEVGLHGTVIETMQKLLPHLRARTNSDFLQAGRRQHAADEQHLAELAAGQPDEQTLHPQHLARLLDELGHDDAIFTCDVGTPLAWAGRYLRMNGHRRLINSFVYGSMGAALPQAIGAALAAPGRQVVALCGDGGFAMLLGELLTLRQANVPIKVVVFNNSGYRYAAQQLAAAGGSAFGTALDNPNFAKLAEAAGLKGLRVSGPAQLEAVLREALAHDGPVVVDAVVCPSELVPPPHLGTAEAKGGRLSAVKALLTGPSTELLTQVKTKLLG
ncbi:MAG: thiamine pyrophosphate-dependent enzyme [Janthinobacterium lividum]